MTGERVILVEAMACGTPVIALRNDSVPEVASDGETDFMVESLEGTAVYQKSSPVTTERASSFTPNEPHTLRALAPDRLG